MRLYPVTAQDFEFFGVHLGHRNLGRAVVGDHESDLYMFASSTYVLNRIEARRGMPQGIQRNVGAAVGDVDDGLCDVDTICVDRRRRAQRLGERQGLVRDIDGDNSGAHRSRDHHGRQTDAAAAVHGDPLPGRYAALIDDRAKRCCEAAAETRRRFEVDRIGQGDDVEVGVMNRDELGEGAPMGESGLKLVVADLLMSGVALRARAAAADERNDDAVAHACSPYVLTYCCHGSCEFVPRNVRQPDVGIVAHPTVPVASTYARRFDLDDDAVRRQRRVVDGDDLRGFFKGFE